MTKEEYKKKEADFKKTYIGRTWFIKLCLSNVLFVVACFEVIIGAITDYMDKVVFTVDSVDIIYYICVLLLGVITIFYQIEYRRELKSIMTCKNK